MIAAMLPRFDAFVLAPEWQELLARTVLQGMTAGLVVVGTPTGGVAEVLADGVTGLAFTAGNPGILADRIQRLRKNPVLRQVLARPPRAAVAERFSLSRMVDELEEPLTRVVKGAGHHSSGRAHILEGGIV